MQLGQDDLWLNIHSSVSAKLSNKDKIKVKAVVLFSLQAMTKRTVTTGIMILKSIQ